MGGATLADSDSITGKVTVARTYCYSGQGGTSYESHFASSVWDEASPGSLPNSSDASPPPSSYAALTQTF
jgi:hypothetical protein